MEAFGRYLLNLPKYNDRVFVSNPPSAALLIWSNSEFLPNVSGITIVEKFNSNNDSGIPTARLISILKRQLYNTVPFVHIQYDEQMEFMLVNDEKMGLEDAANRISSAFSISIGRNAAKAPNNPAQIRDPFHLWSREAFDGHSVFKTDIDILTTKIEAKVEKIKTIIEVKRSNKVKVGQWQPYVDPNRANDINNYLITISLCNLLKANFLTVHHEVMDENAILNGNEVIDCFWHHPVPNQNTLDSFSSIKNRKSLTINSLLGIE